MVRAGQARLLYNRWCATYGTSHRTSVGDLWTAPDPRTVLRLGDEAFAAVGTAFHRTALQAAAGAYLNAHDAWRELGPEQLVEALCAVPRIGPWTARAAVTDFTGDFSVYPHDDLAMRTWARRAAPDVAWPEQAAAFGRAWTARAESTHELHAITALTLAWGNHARTGPEPEHHGPDQPAAARSGRPAVQLDLEFAGQRPAAG